MAAGDVVNGISSLAASTALTYQPAAGVEVVIFLAGNAWAGGAEVYLYDGTNSAMMGVGLLGVTYMGTAYQHSGVRQLGITNNRYLRILNNTGGTLVVGYSGVQTK